jgi:hypothetical protein
LPFSEREQLRRSAFLDLEFSCGTADKVATPLFISEFTLVQLDELATNQKISA